MPFTETGSIVRGRRTGPTSSIYNLNLSPKCTSKYHHFLFTTSKLSLSRMSYRTPKQSSGAALSVQPPPEHGTRPVNAADGVICSLPDLRTRQPQGTRRHRLGLVHTILLVIYIPLRVIRQTFSRCTAYGDSAPTCRRSGHWTRPPDLPLMHWHPTRPASTRAAPGSELPG